ncbi:hypothetical protein C0993_004658 [Termitomyces sp. T159_Od127]|nr:hypothetical protein C0993_004658 [Termitomyces sp. T159_Od127]
MVPRAVAQNEGPGATDGVVLPLQVVATSVFDIAYTIDARVGADAQKLSLQVDTGSSDLWIASKSCSSSVCAQTNGHLYDSSSAAPTGQDFTIRYLQGNVSGPIVWDKFDIGGYSLDSQALGEFSEFFLTPLTPRPAAATDVDAEPLSPGFSGILGLALPLNSIIAGQIPPVTSNSPDGAAWASNLFSITPVSSAPSARFLSLLLSRPGSDAVPAQLGIGRHPSFVKDPSAVQYAALESEREGTLFWKVSVREITVWVDGEARPVQIGTSRNGAQFPSAVLDSGVPVIFAPSAVANGIYGAIGINPASDGQYYVPCTTPLNLTITLDDRTAIPLHPLDLTAKPANDNTARFCTGIIQALDSSLTPADMILGVPFLRNAYTVMAYEPPSPSGAFNTPTNSSTGAGNIKPRLGLVGITDPATALGEFNTVRVLNEPLPSGSSAGAPPGDTGAGTTLGAHRVSVGIIVLVALLGFFALCLALFGVRWWLTRRRFRRAEAGAGAGAGASTAASVKKEAGYAYAYGKEAVPGTELYADEETMRSARWEPYMQDHGLVDLRRAPADEGWGEREDTLVGGRREAVRAHERTPSTGVPLLHMDEFGVRQGARASMAGVGTARWSGGER